MVIRGGVQIDKPADGARDFRGTSLKDLAIRCMERDGEDVKDLILRSPDEIYGMLCRQFYNPSASFPAIMDEAINKAYVEGHNKAQATFDRWVKKGTLKDFKSTKHEYIAGPAGDFYEVPENGEIKHDTRKISKGQTDRLRPMHVSLQCQDRHLSMMILVSSPPFRRGMPPQPEERRISRHTVSWLTTIKFMMALRF